MAKDPPLLLSLCGATVERVPVFKLLGVHVSSDLKWTKHIDAVVSKAASRLYFLKQLRRADVPTRDLLHFYTTVVRPVLEYACPVWHPGLTAAHSELLESVQKRAIRIIYPDANYRTSLIVAGIDTLDERREVLTAKFFKRHVLASSSVLHSLLPDRRNNVTMILLAACEIQNPFTQSKHLLINSVNRYTLLSRQVHIVIPSYPLSN